MSRFSSVSCKPMIADPRYVHRVGPVHDDGSPIVFHWKFQRGLLKPRMSGLELAEFVLGHMPAIVGLLADYPRVQAEFYRMLVLLATSPKEATDQLLPWIRSVTREEQDDVICMSLFDRTEQPAGPAYFILGER